MYLFCNEYLFGNFRWEIEEDYSSCDDVQTDDISVSSSSPAGTPSKGKISTSANEKDYQQHCLYITLFDVCYNLLQSKIGRLFENQRRIDPKGWDHKRLEMLFQWNRKCHLDNTPRNSFVGGTRNDWFRTITLWIAHSWNPSFLSISVSLCQNRKREMGLAFAKTTKFSSTSGTQDGL